MDKTYCGACRGERGCADCKTVAKTVVYTGLTEFFSVDTASEVSHKSVGQSDAKLPKEFLLAADLGTTTLAFVCANEQGEVLASYGTENPQRRVSADVIGRMDAALHGQGEKLTKEIKEALVKGFLFVLNQGITETEYTSTEAGNIPIRIAIAGNTTMLHILLGYPLDGMAKTPFTPYTTEGKRVKFSALFGREDEVEVLPERLKAAEVIIFPCFSAFVGGDAVAGGYALFRQRKEQTGLLIDLGTNGELLLSVKGKMFGTAAAMGSAFEGGRYAYASELFRLIAEARKQGVMDETGLLCEPYFAEGFQGLQQEDIRQFQLAKGALRAGVEVLCNYAGVTFPEVEQIFIAGGVGRFCRTEDLFASGLLPQAFSGRVTFVGNSCIGGMLSCLKNRESMIYCKGDMLNMAEEPGFEGLYYRFMNFEKEE